MSAARKLQRAASEAAARDKYTCAWRVCRHAAGVPPAYITPPRAATLPDTFAGAAKELRDVDARSCRWPLVLLFAAIAALRAHAELLPLMRADARCYARALQAAHSHAFAAY